MRKVLLSVLIVSICSFSVAAVRTVNSAGGADHTTIAAAITAAGPNDEIRVIGGGPYDEAISITKPLILIGYGYRPVLCVQQSGGSYSNGNDGVYIEADGTVTLENLIIIPSRTTTPGDDALFATGGSDGGTLNLNIIDVLVCPNNGADAALVTDPFTKEDTTGATMFADDGLYIMGTSVYGGRNCTINCTLDDVILTHQLSGGTNDGAVIAGPNTTAHIKDGCIASFNTSRGFQLLVDGTFYIQGTESEPVWAVGNWMGVVSYSGTHDYEYLYITCAGSAVADPIANQIDPDTVAAYSASHCIYADALEGLHFEYDPPGAKTFTLNDCSFYNITMAIEVWAVVSSSLTCTVTDSILAGSIADDYAVRNQGSAVVNLNYCGLVTAGGSALTGVDHPGSSTAANQSNVVNADPFFVSTTFGDADYLCVANPFYGDKASGGGPLTGAGDYCGATPTPTPLLGVTTPWSLYD